MSSGGKASVRQLELPLATPGDEAIARRRGEDAPVEEKNLLERRLEAQHRRRARHQVRRHQGAPGIDGMTVDDLGAYLKTHLAERGSTSHGLAQISRSLLRGFCTKKQ